MVLGNERLWAPVGRGDSWYVNWTTFFSAVSIFWIMATCCCPVSNYTHYYCVSHKNWGMFINSRECPFLFFMGKIWDLSHSMSFSTCSQGILIAKNKGDLKIAQTTYPKTLLRWAKQWYSKSSLLVVTYGVREKTASFSYLEQKSCKICKLVNEQLCSYGMSENRWNHFSW